MANSQWVLTLFIPSITLLHSSLYFEESVNYLGLTLKLTRYLTFLYRNKFN